MKRLKVHLVLRFIALLTVLGFTELEAWINRIDEPFNCSSGVWVHPPKTGSSFCLSIQHVCCTDDFEDMTKDITKEQFEIEENFQKTEYQIQHGSCFTLLRKEKEKNSCNFREIAPGVHSDHNPLLFDPEKRNSSVVMMIRKPLDRLISSFLDAVPHHEHIPTNEYNEWMKKRSEYLIKEKSFSKVAAMAQAYADHPGVIGCQVKMILGFWCHATHKDVNLNQFNKKIVYKAVDRLKKFYFVGLSNEFNRSLHLFHAMAGLGTIPSVVELTPQRTCKTPGDEKNLHKIVKFNDPYDSLLYLEAQKIFNQEVEMVKKYFNILI